MKVLSSRPSIRGGISLCVITAEGWPMSALRCLAAGLAPAGSAAVNGEGLANGAVEAADCPCVGGRAGGHGVQVVAGTGVGAGHLRPAGAVPPEDKGQVHDAIGGTAHRPCVACGGRGHTVEDVVVSWASLVWAGHLLPSGAGPVQDESLVRGAVGGKADRPRVRCGRGTDAVK